MKSPIIEVVTTWFAIFSTKKKYWNISRLDSDYGWFGLSCGMFAILQKNKWWLGKIGILQIISWILKVTWYEWVDLKATNFLDLLSICTSDLVQIWASYSRNKISNRALLKGGFFFVLHFVAWDQQWQAYQNLGKHTNEVANVGNFKLLFGLVWLCAIKGNCLTAVTAHIRIFAHVCGFGC
jgi:hypothetical protein